MTTMTRNEAAERLLRDYHKWTHEGIAVGLDAALAAERRSTVERIRKAMFGRRETIRGDVPALQLWELLDEEAAR